MCRGSLIIYTLTIIGTQLTFFVCIQYANAPFAAVLTATVPLWIMLFMFVFQHKHLTVKEIFCGIVAVAGVVLVVTGGSFKNFNVSGIGFWAGIGSGITFQLLLKGCTIEAPKPTDWKQMIFDSWFLICFSKMVDLHKKRHYFRKFGVIWVIAWLFLIVVVTSSYILLTTKSP